MKKSIKDRLTASRARNDELIKEILDNIDQYDMYQLAEICQSIKPQKVRLFIEKLKDERPITAAFIKHVQQARVMEVVQKAAEGRNR